MPAPEKNPGNFLEILQYIWWNLDKKLDKEMVEASALATALACAKAGSTFVIDHHASPNFIEGSLQVLADAFDKVGVNHLLCYEISDRDGEEKAAAGLAETAAYLESHQGLVGLHASFTVGDKTMKKAAELIEKYHSGVHIHVAEDKMDETDSLEKYNMRVVERLNEFGFLKSSKTILAHCLHIDDLERRQIGESPVWVVENMESNLDNRVGLFSSKGLSDKIMLGTDGMHSDMLQSAKAAFFAGQLSDNIDYVTAYRRFRNVHRYLKENSFSGDGDNNLVVLDYDAPTGMNTGNFYGHFLFGLNATHIRHVISNGKPIIKDRVLQTVNEQELLQFTKQQANRLWERLK
jgi:cytosine/adenosine deaminase-related metal-dependent hydrolase